MSMSLSYHFLSRCIVGLPAAIQSCDHRPLGPLHHTEATCTQQQGVKSGDELGSAQLFKGGVVLQTWGAANGAEFYSHRPVSIAVISPPPPGRRSGIRNHSSSGEGSGPTSLRHGRAGEGRRSPRVVRRRLQLKHGLACGRRCRRVLR
jgi:hypothetical protein